MELVIDSTYKPLSFQELILPFVEYKKDYEKIEEDYSNLVALTEAWRNIANREKSPEAFEMFSRYANLLNAIVDDFSQGMNPRNRGLLLAMKRGYASNILPIAQAAEAMKQANALRDEKGPDAIFEEGRYDSIDRFLNGQVANNKYESRKDISARTAALTLAAAQSILHDPEIKLALGEYGNQFLEVIQKTGLGGLAELESAIRGDAAAENAFAKIKLHMLTEIGGLDRFDSVGRQAIELAINEGLYAGLHNYSTALLANGEYVSKAQRLSNALGWAKYNLDKQLYDDAKTIRENNANMDAGRVPREVLPNGTKVFWTSTGSYWTIDKNGVTSEVIRKPLTSGGDNLTNPDSTLKQDNALAASVSVPLYFEARGGSGGKGYQGGLTKWTGSSNEGAEYLLSELTGNAKEEALKYIGNLVGVSDFSDVYENLTNDNKQKLELAVKVYRDQDWFSDNHFAVYLDGVDFRTNKNHNNKLILSALKILKDIIKLSIDPNALPKSEKK